MTRPLFFRYSDFKNLICKNYYDIAHQPLKSGSLPEKNPICPVQLYETPETFPSSLPPSKYPYFQLFLPTFSCSIEYVFPSENNQFMVCFWEKHKKWTPQKMNERDDIRQLHSVQVLMAHLCYQNIQSDVYTVKTKDTEFKMKVNLSMEDLLEMQKKIFFIKYIYYQIHRNPTSWSSSFYPLFQKDFQNKEKITHGIAVAELSLLSGVGPENRQKLHEDGIVSIKDLSEDDPLIRNNENRLLINGLHPTKTLDCPDTWVLVDPRIKDDPLFIKTLSHFQSSTILYLDFEYIHESGKTLIYLTGITNHDDEPIVFWDHHSEKTLFGKLYHFLQDHSDSIIVYYQADKSQYESMAKKYNVHVDTSNWVDLKYFTKTFCAFRGCFTSSVKDIIHSFSENGVYHDPYNGNDTCNNGLDSISMFFNYRSNPVQQETLREKLILYNYEDCVVQRVILTQIIDSLP